jgi:hypothetical protein
MKTYLNYILTGLALFFAPIQGLLIAVAFGIMLDTFTGIFKSIKLNGLKSIRSRTLSNIISKMLLYQVCIISLYMIDKYLLNELVNLHFSTQFLFTKLIAIILVFIELVSIKENIEEALNVDIWKLLKNLIRRAKEVKTDIDSLK